MKVKKIRIGPLLMTILGFVALEYEVFVELKDIAITLLLIISMQTSAILHELDKIRKQNDQHQ